MFGLIFQNWKTTLFEIFWLSFFYESQKLYYNITYIEVVQGGPQNISEEKIYNLYINGYIFQKGGPLQKVDHIWGLCHHKV